MPTGSAAQQSPGEQSNDGTLAGCLPFVELSGENFLAAAQPGRLNFCSPLQMPEGEPILQSSPAGHCQTNEAIRK